MSKVKNKTLTDDMLQDTFIKVHTKLDSLNDASKLKSWLFSIAHHTILDYYKTNKLTPHVVKVIEIDEEYKAHSEKDCLRGILANLPKKYKEPLFLSDIMGLKQQEVAKQLNIPLSTAKSQIQRARKQVAKGFMNCCGFQMNKKGHLVGELKNREECKVCN